MNGSGKRLAVALALSSTLVLSACNTPELLTLRNPSTNSTPAAPAPAGTQPAAPTATPPTVQSAAIALGSAKVQLAPVVGAPSGAFDPLSSRLTERAQRSKFTMVPSGDASATHTLKGFFSTSTEGNQTIVFYVWDVIDKAGNRVHRFSGQESAKGASPDGWSVVTDETMNAIADRTAQDLGAWLATRAG